MDTSPSVTLRNIKHAVFASHETHCYEATVLLDGKRVCKVENDGRGGCDNHYPFHGQSKESFDESYKSLKTACLATLKDDDPEMYAMLTNRSLTVTEFDTGDAISTHEFTFGADEVGSSVIDIVVGHFLNRHLAKKELKQLMRSKIIIVEKSTDDVYEVKMKPTEENLRYVKVKYGADHLILNGMTEEDQLYYWIKKS